MNLKDIDKILLFGKSRAFSSEEFSSQMKYHKIEVVKEYSEDVSLLVDGRMMTPFEQNLSDELYETQNVESISIDVLERELAKFIDDNTLLMSLKLSHDKERLKSFIQNSCISDALFFKLIKMYSWSHEDFFENDDNRDVSAAFISRFYENIERNHNVQYATTGFMHLVSQAKSSTLLEAILLLEPMQYHPKIKRAIAMSPFSDVTLQKRLFKLGDAEIKEALCLNKKLSLELVDVLIEEEKYALLIARNRELDDELFERLKKYAFGVAQNETLTLVMQEKLLALKESEVNLAMALNSAVNVEILKRLLEDADDAQKEHIYTNSAMPVAFLEEAYSQGKFFASLAKNESTPIEILYQLQLDSRYERAVKTNAGFGKHIQSENIGWLV